MNTNYIKLNEKNISDRECPICFENLYKYSYLEFKDCNHFYHIQCLNNWKIKKKDSISDNFFCEECQSRREVNKFKIVEEINNNKSNKNKLNTNTTKKNKINNLFSKCFNCIFK